MRTFLMIAIVALVAAGVAPRYLERAGAPPAPSAQAAVPAQPAVPTVSPGPRSIVLARDGRGHFQVDGIVDGRRIRFMVDTGATSIALRESDAARLGIHPSRRDYSGQSSTANGIVRVAPVRLDMVEVGGVVVRNVAAVVFPDSSLGENLLGMSFLSRLRRFEYREGRMVLEE